jgi:iron complex transport system substrate-binding protein
MADGLTGRDGSTDRDDTTRREYVKYGGTVVGGGLLAGCSTQAGTDAASSGEVSSETTTATETTATAATETPSSTSESTSETDSADDSWTVAMEPAGTRTFTSVPESYVVYHRGWADIMASLGQFDRLEGMLVPESFFPTEFYNRLPGVEIDLSGVQNLFGGSGDSVDKEVFYELAPDISMIDPYVATDYLGLDDESVEELEETIGPFFGSFMRRPQYTDEHPYYSLYEGTKRAAAVFQQQDRYEALKSFHDEFLSSVRERLPPATNRPSYAYMNMNWWGEFNEVYARKARVSGYQHKPFRDLNVQSENNAFRDDFAAGKRSLTTDLEGLLEADPEVIVWHGGYTLVGGYSPGWYDGTMNWEEGVVETLRDDPVASEVTAVKEGRILPGNVIEAGPVTNLFNTEDIAKQLYPEEFGEFKPGEYDEEERLFDRQRLAEIVTGSM